jgi:hypothetical protein
VGEVGLRIGLSSWKEREALLVLLVALHSYGVGLILMFASGFAMRFGGWGDEGTQFFTRQGGVFHLIVATLYLIDYFRRDSILPIVLAKSIAVIFLFALAVMGEPWAVWFSGTVDALMLVSVLALRVLSRSRRDADADAA